MKNSLRTLAGLASLSLIAVAVSGFVYDESVQGNIHQHGNNGSAPKFHLDPGVNVIRGSTFLSSEPSIAESDRFTIKVPAGMVLQLNATTYEYSFTDMFGDLRVVQVAIGIESGVPQNTSYSTGDASGPFFCIFSDGSQAGFDELPSPVNLQFFEVVNSSVDLNRPVVTLPAGNYVITPGAGWIGNGVNGATWDYQITFVVNPAP